MSITTSQLRLADRIWLAVAMLQQRSSDAAFSKDEIRQELYKSELGNGTKPASVNAHLKQHLVANVPPSTGKYTMLFETRGGLRLYRPGDLIDPQRRSERGTKHMPKREEVPSQYHHLLDWYEEWIGEQAPARLVTYDDDPLIRLIGSGKHIWADEHADEYVENLRREDI
ncbi:MAG: hypothetical protein ACLGSH_14605 [Acidobacteriota bacterium]